MLNPGRVGGGRVHVRSHAELMTTDGAAVAIHGLAHDERVDDRVGVSHLPPVGGATRSLRFGIGGQPAGAGTVSPSASIR